MVVDSSIMTFNPKDRFFHKAKKENFVARSIYKLEEIDQKFKLLKPGQVVLDLGAAPGSWSQYISPRIGPQGKLLGIDLKPIDLHFGNAEFIQGNALEFDWNTKLQDFKGFDVVVSDMAPSTTGIKFTDQTRSFELCEMALGLALKHLKPKGHFVCKLFHSADFGLLKKTLQKNFEKFETLKPEATRTISKEIFLVGIQRKVLS
jgi:23S rRNA (uridine2552-2'-O)-methyltransferase